eukprot:2562136-Rhodomonas_salina.3
MPMDALRMVRERYMPQAFRWLGLKHATVGNRPRSTSSTCATSIGARYPSHRSSIPSAGSVHTHMLLRTQMAIPRCKSHSLTITQHCGVDGHVLGWPSTDSSVWSAAAVCVSASLSVSVSASPHPRLCLSPFSLLRVLSVSLCCLSSCPGILSLLRSLPYPRLFLCLSHFVLARNRPRSSTACPRPSAQRSSSSSRTLPSAPNPKP